LMFILSLYQRTYLYRDLKLRGAIVQAGQLVILPDEEVFSHVQGVWNLSSDQGNLGSFVVTNIRLVWFADANETFNISLPYLQIESVIYLDRKRINSRAASHYSFAFGSPSTDLLW